MWDARAVVQFQRATSRNSPCSAEDGRHARASHYKLKIFPQKSCVQHPEIPRAARRISCPCARISRYCARISCHCARISGHFTQPFCGDFFELRAMSRNARAFGEIARANPETARASCIKVQGKSAVLHGEFRDVARRISGCRTEEPKNSARILHQSPQNRSVLHGEFRDVGGRARIKCLFSIT